MNIKSIVRILLVYGLALSTSVFAASLDIGVTGNNRGLLTPCGCSIPAGGWARVHTVMNSLSKPQVRVAAGNQFFHHTPMPKEDQIFEQKKAAFQAKMFSELKYDVINTGQFDLCYGINVLRSMQNTYSLPLISANILDLDDNLVFPPYKLIEQNGIKMLFVGICSLENGFNFKVKDPMEALVQLQDSGIFMNADIVILLADAPGKMLMDMAKRFEGIDIIIASKDHTITGLPVHYGNTALMQLGSQGKYLGRLRLIYDDEFSKWTDGSPLDNRITALEISLKDVPDQKIKRQRQLRHYKKQLKKLEKSGQNLFLWDMIFMDGAVKDDPEIKKEIETYMPYPE